jgi:NADH-quinone oxidoreductase subunit G
LALAAKIAQACGALRDDWNGFNVLHTAAARVGGLDIGFVPGGRGMATAGIVAKAEVLILLGADEVDLGKRNGFTIYIGSHGDHGAHRADVILPGAAFTEKPGTYVNTEGRVQMANRATFPPGEAKEDWAILRALSEACGRTLPFDTLAQLRALLHSRHPHLSAAGEVASGKVADVRALATERTAAGEGPFSQVVADFYLTNPVARASRALADCSRLAAGGKLQAAE